MKRKKILLAFVLLLILLMGVIFLLKRNFDQKPINTIESNNYHREIERTTNSLLHWSSKVSPNRLYRGDSYTGDYADKYNYYQLFVTDLTSGKKQRTYNGDFRTMGWEWTGDSRIKITYNCGTGCQATRIIGPDETAYVNDSESGFISKENGWELEFFRSF